MKTNVTNNITYTGNVNNVTLKGVITSLHVNGSGILYLTVMTGAPHYHYPSVRFFGDLATSVMEKYKIGDLVEVRGYVRSHLPAGNLLPDKIVWITGTSVCPALEGEEGVNCLTVSGYVVPGAKAFYNYARFNVFTFIDGILSIFPVFYFTDDPGGFIDTLTPGQEISFTGAVQTRKIVSKKGVPVYYQDYVAYNFAPAEPAASPVSAA